MPGIRLETGVLVLGQVAGRRTTGGVLYFLAQKAGKRLGRPRRNGALPFGSVVELSHATRYLAGSSPAIAAMSTDKMQGRAPVRVESGSRPKPSGNSAVWTSQAKGPWRNAARLGSPQFGAREAHGKRTAE